MGKAVEQAKKKLPRSGFVHLASILNQTIIQISDSYQNTGVLLGARLAVFEGCLQSMTLRFGLFLDLVFILLEKVLDGFNQ